MNTSFDFNALAAVLINLLRVMITKRFRIHQQIKRIKKVRK